MKQPNYGDWCLITLANEHLCNCTRIAQFIGIAFEGDFFQDKTDSFNHNARLWKKEEVIAWQKINVTPDVWVVWDQTRELKNKIASLESELYYAKRK